MGCSLGNQGPPPGRPGYELQHPQSSFRLGASRYTQVREIRVPTSQILFAFWMDGLHDTYFKPDFILFLISTFL